MRNNNSIDGFVPRRPSARMEHAQHLARRQQQAANSGRAMRTNIGATARPVRPIGETHRFVGQAAQGSSGLTRNQIDESLKSIESTLPQDKKSKKKSKFRKSSKGFAKPTRKQLIKRIAISIAIIVVIIGGFIGIRALLASNNIFKGNILSVLNQQPLKTDANGRSNILIFGTAEDSEGGEHGGANLTDSIMVLSVDQKKNDAYMLNLPRDLWVEYENTCTVGNEGKLNAVYFCASNDGQNENQGAAALQRKVGEITGLEVQYFAHVNFTVVVESVDAVGGIDVKVESEDPRGILDRNFDWKCNYQCYYVNYENGEVAHMDGEHALAFMRARNAQGGYGLPNGNFDRERNQQKVIVALRDKALSAGTLTNLGAVTGLIDAMGNNLRTNFEAGEIRTLMSIAKEVSADKIVSLSLNDEEEPMVTTGDYYGQSIVQPIAGIHQYGDIHEYVRSNVAATPLTREKAAIMVLNGTSTPGLASEKAESLESSGFKVREIGNAPESNYGSVEVYNITSAKPETAKALKSFYGVELKTGTPAGIMADGMDFVVIYGEQTATSN